MRERRLMPFEKYMSIRRMPVSKVIAILRAKSLLASSIKCLSCGLDMIIRSRKTQDEECWSCRNKNCKKFKSTLSIRNGSFFDSFSLPLSEIFTIIILWSYDKPLKSMVSDYGMNKVTAVKVIKKLRSITANYYLKANVRLGGPGVVCQVDESLFVHKVKHHRGRAPETQVWVFGIADTSFTPSRCYMQIVKDRTEKNLLPIILKICKPGIIIYSDGWAGYQGIKEKLKFEHFVVNHSKNSVDPVTGIHTQNIESSWNKFKVVIKSKFGISKVQLPGLLNELMFKDEFKKNVLLSLFNLLAV